MRKQADKDFETAFINIINMFKNEKGTTKGMKVK